jgi:hypothetical protein
MSKHTILSGFLGVALMAFAACSNEREEAKQNDVNALQDIAFKVDFEGYNADGQKSGTRTAGNDILAEGQGIDLGNGLLADYTLKYDAQEVSPVQTRAQGSSTYTMLVFDAATKAFKGEMKGSVSAGGFAPDKSSPAITLAAGKYDFVLYNNKFTRNGNNLTVARADASTAFFGRTTQDIATATNKPTVRFSLKRPAARIKIKVNSSIVPGTGLKAKLEGINANAVPASATYNAATGTWTTAAGAPMSANLTFPAAQKVGNAYTTVSNQAVVVLLSTEVSKLKLTFTAGTIYNVNLVNKVFTFGNGLTLEPNRSYELNVNLNFAGHQYLFTDGSVGGFNESINGGGRKTPAALVVDKANRIAIALTDARDPHYGAEVSWCEPRFYNTQCNGKNTPVLSWALTSSLYITSGYKETWEGRFSTGTIGSKAHSTSFRAFKIAAEYTPAAGTPSSWRWFLPSYSDWKAAFGMLGFGDTSQVKDASQRYSWNGSIVDKLFRQAGGQTILNKHYWTSTEYQTTEAGTVNPTVDGMAWYSQIKGAKAHVRPFIKF